ncbi:MAG TPA: SUMF1/EgtB/PvdO family nonheme iron enzyme, partial [Nitrospiria bacterium]|nr:SUMF1/EgtB/PvdO family nonheme iron enzyme [Nitrospiria bacterium]
MVRVPAGEFIMGSDKIDTEGKASEFGTVKPWFMDEHPERKVFLPEFYIDKFEVTNAKYREFVEATGSRPPQHWQGGLIPAG